MSQIRRSIARHVFLGVLIFLSIGRLAGAGEVTYIEKDKVVWVRDSHEETPATPAAILAADKRNGWGRVSYDGATDTTTINASLWIGDDVALGAFFQIGRKDHPRETLIVRGDVWIKPSKDCARRSDGRLSIVNRLRLGDPNDDATRATLKIACEKRRQYGVRIGFRYGKKWISRGELHVYNSTITAAVQDKNHTLKPWGWYGSDVRLINATISWIEGSMVYGVQAHNSKIEGTTFEHGGAALQNGRQIARNCTFRHLETAIAEGGCLDATLIGCTFEDNGRNWTLGGYGGFGVKMIDCDIGPQRRPLQLLKNRISPQEAAQRKVPVYPAYTEWRTLVLKVVEPEGWAVPDAMIGVGCPEHPEAVQNGLTLTDEKGLTPADMDDGAVLITTKKLQPTDDPEKPTAFQFNYRISVHKRGYEAKELFLSGNDALSRPMIVFLRRRRQ